MAILFVCLHLSHSCTALTAQSSNNSKLTENILHKCVQHSRPLTELIAKVLPVTVSHPTDT